MGPPGTGGGLAEFIEMEAFCSLLFFVLPECGMPALCRQVSVVYQNPRVGSQKWPGWGSLVHLYGTLWAPSPQHLKFRLWLALSSLLATQGAAVCLAEDSIDLSGGRSALEVYRLTFASGRRWQCVLDCSGSLLKAGSFVSVHTFLFQMVCLFSVPIIGSGEPAPSFRVLPAQTLSLTE